jgi:acyl-CoA thioester hydrolase
MPEFKYYYPIEVRYGDLDPQGHVNNAKYLTYMEQARTGYLRHLGLWKGGSFMDLGIILADAQITFQAPILFEHSLQVGVRTARLGNKSFDVLHSIENSQDGSLFATGKSVLVAYDYHTQRTLPIPDSWREILSKYEQLG